MSDTTETVKIEFKPWQQRVVEEKRELDVKIEALELFLRGDVYCTLSPGEMYRLDRQLLVMSEYSRILEERIAALEG